MRKYLNTELSFYSKINELRSKTISFSYIQIHEKPRNTDKIINMFPEAIFSKIKDKVKSDMLSVK